MTLSLLLQMAGAGFVGAVAGLALVGLGWLALAACKNLASLCMALLSRRGC